MTTILLFIVVHQTSWYNWNIVESGVKEHKINKQTNKQIDQIYWLYLKP